MLVSWMNYAACFGQHRRTIGESLETFAERIKPVGSELTHKVLTLPNWHTHQNVVLAFYATTLHEQIGKETFSQDLILGKLYLPLKDSLYQEVLLDSLYGEGGTPIIESVFLAEVNEEYPGKELLVLVSSQFHHYDASGTHYYVSAYNTDGLTMPKRLAMVYDFGATSDIEYREGEKKQANYRTAKEFLAYWKRHQK